MQSSDPGNICEVEEGDFQEEVLQGPGITVVGFLTPWSMACKVLQPVLAKAAERLNGKARVLQVNVDDYPDLGVWYNIDLIPTLLYFVDGTVRARIVGTASVEAIISRLDSCANKPQKSL